VLVMRRGRVTGEFTRTQATSEALLSAASGA
jgi:ABC-type sugar transport system ATPase subunit